ncbi:LysR substrate-binding domain-containing protein [Trinickia fusca]|uniref:LysR substrate-binding domain-containing protein n=1 Tax=Trinickia fusca TaxID=2419777 RepID=UPI0024827611|nr:LysR substrate-binding domain-containing protein [Trinickia fusca]
MLKRDGLLQQIVELSRRAGLAHERSEAARSDELPRRSERRVGRIAPIIPQTARLAGIDASLAARCRPDHAVAWVSRHIVAEELAAGVLVQLPVHDLKIERELNMIWRQSRTLSPSARAFRTLATQMFASTAASLPQ